MAEKKAADVSVSQARAVDKRLCSWGANGHGQLGIASTEDQLLPVKVKVDTNGNEGDRVLEVGGGGGFSYILRASGTVQTCGNNDKGQLGRGGELGQQGGQLWPSHEDIFRPCGDVTLRQLRVDQVAAGWDFLVALCGDGSLFSWGSNAFGQLGRDLGHGGVKFTSKPGTVSFPQKTRQTFVAAGLRHVLSLAEDGSVFAWGHGRKGQLGLEKIEGKNFTSSNVPVMVPISNADSITCLFAGLYHSGVLTESGSMFLWGCNKYGQCCVKEESVSIVYTPTKANLSLKDEGEKLTAVSSGWSHLVARSNKGRLYSWGRKDLGQLGRLSGEGKAHLPELIEGLESVIKHACGSEHNLALTNDRCLYSWGWNEHGICATGDEENVPYPRKVSAIRNQMVENIGCGAGHSFCITSVETQS